MTNEELKKKVLTLIRESMDRYKMAGAPWKFLQEDTGLGDRELRGVLSELEREGVVSWAGDRICGMVWFLRGEYLGRDG